jgi:SAM-dependent methyltransferase
MPPSPCSSVADPLDAVRRYYTAKVTEHGPTPRGVDWNDETSQTLRFEQLLKISDPASSFTINDYGCGYGALAVYLSDRGHDFTYTGFDISERMLDEARSTLGQDDRIRFVAVEEALEPADFTVASGVFNVRLDATLEIWEEYVRATLARFDLLSRRGFAFNMLTSYSDPERMRPDLYYPDPRVVFDDCKRTFSRWVALLHDYGLYEFTILVRKEQSDR